MSQSFQIKISKRPQEDMGILQRWSSQVYIGSSFKFDGFKNRTIRALCPLSTFAKFMEDYQANC